MLAHVDSRITYNGNGNATEFAYQFKILDRTDIKVLLADADGKEKLLTKDYYVDVEKNVVRYPGYAVGAEVPESERPPVLPTGWKLTIYREVPVTQETDLPDQYPFNQVEDIGDKLTMIAQQLTDVTSRSLKISVNKSADIDTIIPFDAGKSFRIADDGKSIVLTEDPARVLPLAQGVYAQAQAQAQSAYASAAAAAQSEDSAAASASEAGNSAQSASTSAASAAESAELTSGYKQEALAAKADATTSATNAKTSETNAGKSASAASASQTAAKASETSAANSASTATTKASEASASATKAKTSETTATQQAAKATTEANRAKTEADRAKTAADSVGNPVVSITQSNGNLTVTKGDGSSDTLTVTPAKATKEDAEKGTDDNKVMTPLRTKQAVEKFAPLKTVNGQSPDDSGNVDVSDTTPVGDVVYRPYLRAGYVKANGATVQRADYPTLVQYAEDNDLWTDTPATEPWKFGRGDGSNTMALPDFRNVLIQGGDIPEKIEAGIPNVTATVADFDVHADNGLIATGACSVYASGGTNKGGGSWVTGISDSFMIDASRSSSVYRDIDTVQPPAIVLIPQIKY